MTPEVPKTWIYIDHVAQMKFIIEVFSAKAVLFRVSCRHAWRNLYRHFISNEIAEFYMVKAFWAFDVCVCTFYILYETSSCWQYIMFVLQLVIFISSGTRFYSIFYMGWFYVLFISMFVYMCYFCMYMLFCNRAPWRTDWLNGPPCINTFEIRIK